MIVPLGELAPHLDTKKISDLSEMDAPENMDLLQELGLLGGARDVTEKHFAAKFDLA